jgi:orotate phosphoribosyltransferase-like protein
MKLNVLHLTDFHVNMEGKDPLDVLREGVYEEYIDKFCEVLLQNAITIDHVIMTGDVVNRGEPESFDHSRKVMSQLARKLKINQSQISFCVGNHDIIRDCEKNDKQKDAREAFVNFRNEYEPSDSIKYDADKFRIQEINDAVLYVSFDATWGKDIKVPGEFTTDEIDTLVAKVNEFKHGKKLIIYGSHYPCVSFIDYPFPEEDGWYDEHFWKCGAKILKRLQDKITDVRSLWLFGDTHQPGHLSQNNADFVMTGRFGTSITDMTKGKPHPISVAPRQAKLIRYDNSRVAIDTFSFAFNGHTEDANLNGSWSQSVETDIHQRLFQPFPIDSDLQDDLLKLVDDNKLYKFGRFRTNVDSSSLGWIPINVLLNDTSIINRIVNSSQKWLEGNSIELRSDSNTLVVGVDFWGAMLASQITLRTGVKNIIVPSRGAKTDYTSLEMPDDADKKPIASTKKLIFIVDVVSSGRSLKDLHDAMKDLCGISEDCDYHCISVLSDIMQPKDVNLKFLKTFGTCCGSLRIPVISDAILPSEAILPATNYFS